MQKGQAVQKQPADLEKHIPVMLAEVLEALIAPAGNTKTLKAQTKAGFARQPANPEQNLVNLQSWQNKLILDGTFGNGGYSRAFLAAGARVLGLDRDPQAVKIGQALEAAAKGRFFIRETEFSKLDKAAEEAGFIPLDAVVLDIGVSSMQIDEGARGFSFRHNGPLDMRMGKSAVSAADVVNRVKANDLARIFYFYGEERFSTRIARMIEARRGQKAFTSTLDLAQSIVAMGLHKHEKIHAATRVFQALRIYVNDELGQLARALFAAERVLKPGGRLAVVTFHSLEDRLVKRFFNDRTGESPVSRYLPQQAQRAAQFIPLFKGAKQASAAEAALNPRSRSAKLRVGIRTEAAAAFENYDIFGLPKLPLLSEI